jgi:putative CocE/NonD family hydrolase
MDRYTKRQFLGQVGAAAGVAMLEARGLRSALATDSRGGAPLWSADAGELKVSPGMWAVTETLFPGIHFESIFLRQPDGIRLHLELYLPMGIKTGQRVPATVESDPYRREPIAPGLPHVDYLGRELEYLAHHGYAATYLGVRGSGTSEGVPSDEYAVDEMEDTKRVIDWISKQRWSNGNVGMYGISYSAFNSVWMAAALKPPALKAIFVRAGTDNRYTDDIHYPGGTMVMVNNAWALGMLTDNATPGAPDYDVNSKASLDRWNTPPWLQIYLRNQLDGPHWQRGSVWPDYTRLTTPTFLAGGYLDKYQNFVPRIMKHSPAVTMGVLGPWHHAMSWPGPVVDWNALMVRWFDHWLKGHDTGMLKEPRVSFYLPEWQHQTFRYKGAIPGEWRYLKEWPETAFEPTDRLYLRAEGAVPLAEALKADPAPGRGGSLNEASGPASALKLQYHPGRGGSDQSFGPTDYNGYYGIDHRDEDAYGLCFDTAPLETPVEILGFAKATLFVSATAPVANWIVRLHDLAPDGTSYLITRGFLNGTHRRSHTQPEALVPGEVYEIQVQLMCTGYKFSPGHRIRVIVTNADFPVIWPSPYAMTTTLYTGGDRPSHISLPVLPPLHYLSGKLPIIAESSISNPLAPPPKDTVRKYSRTRDYSTGETVALFELEDSVLECRVNKDNPGQASLHLNTSAKREAADGRVIETRAVGALSSTIDKFILDMQVTLLENDKIIRSRSWKDEFPRQLL